MKFNSNTHFEISVSVPCWGKAINTKNLIALIIALTVGVSVPCWGKAINTWSNLL